MQDMTNYGKVYAQFGKCLGANGAPGKASAILYNANYAIESGPPSAPAFFA
ncbi:hypothetical protein MCAMS1_01053 [biofilm metagenome]